MNAPGASFSITGRYVVRGSTDQNFNSSELSTSSEAFTARSLSTNSNVVRLSMFSMFTNSAWRLANANGFFVGSLYGAVAKPLMHIARLNRPSTMEMETIEFSRFVLCILSISLTFRQWAHHVHMHRSTASRSAKNGYRIRIASECIDILFDPLQCERLILQCEISRRSIISGGQKSWNQTFTPNLEITHCRPGVLSITYRTHQGDMSSKPI